MTTEKKPHKHADILRAIADGTTVQYCAYGDNTWYDRADDSNAPDPITHDYYEWRIKPEVKPDEVYYMAFGLVSHGPKGETIVEGLASKYFNENVDSLVLVFCGETGKLKSAKVL